MAYYKYHMSANVYNAGLLETLNAQYTNFQVLQGKISSIITDSELKKYQDGTQTWFSEYSLVEQTANKVSADFSQFTVTYGQDKFEMNSLLAQYKTAVDGYSAQLSSVNANYSTVVTNYNTLSGTVDGLSSTVGSVTKSLENDYYTINQTESYFAQEAAKIELRVKQAYISGVSVEYALGTSSTTAPTSGWSSATPQWTVGKYIWQRTVVNKNDKTTYSNVTCIQGAAGVGVSSVEEYYALNNSASSAPADSAFSSGVKTPTASNRYLWNYEKVTYTDGTSKNLDKHVVLMYAQDGQPGSSGVGISSITEYYAINNSTAAPSDSSFSTSIKTVTASNKYLWNYEKIIYSNGSSSVTGKRIIGTYGEKGNTGDNGISVTALTPQYYLSTSNSTTSGGSWQNTPQEYISGRYYWIRTKIDYSNGSTGYSTAVLDTELNSLETRMATAELKITNDSIISTVTGTTAGKAAVNSLIEQKLESIKIKANQIELEGLTTINGLFKINTAGSPEISGGTFAGWQVNSNWFGSLSPVESGRSSGGATITAQKYIKLFKYGADDDIAIDIDGSHLNKVTTSSGAVYYYASHPGLYITYGGELWSTDSTTGQTGSYAVLRDGTVVCQHAKDDSYQYQQKLTLSKTKLEFTGTRSLSTVRKHTVSLNFAGQMDNALYVVGSGGIYAASFHESSDARWKKNIRPFTEPVFDKLNGLEICSYDWIDETKGSSVVAGIIAQNLQTVFPDLITTDDDGYLYISQYGLIPYLVKALQEANARIKNLEDKQEGLS